MTHHKSEALDPVEVQNRFLAGVGVASVKDVSPGIATLSA
jgi:hypothetical protein